MSEKLILIDGNSLLNRAFYAIPALNSRDGVPTNAVYGFSTMLLKMIETIHPTYIGAVFDLKGPTFRHLRYDGYKATRKPMPTDLAVQLPLLKELLGAMNVKCLSVQGYEADDVIGTIASRENVETIIVTGDRDSFQLISPTTKVHFTKRGITDVDVFDEQKFREVYGFAPQGMVDLKSLMGDASDNIPGVPGVGEKTALKLMTDYGSLDGVYAHLDEITGATNRKLTEGKESAYLSYELATICRNAPIEYKLEDLTYDFPFGMEVKRKFEQFAFKSLLNRPVFSEAAQKVEIEATQEQVTLEELKKLDFSKGYALCLAEDGVHFAFNAEVDYAVTIGTDLFSFGATTEDILRAIPYLADGSVKKTVFDAKSLRHTFTDYGLELGGVDIDVQLCQYVTDCVKPNASLSAVLSNFGLDDYEGFPAAGLYRVGELLREEVKPFSHVYYDLELPLSDVLFRMERYGWKVDKAVLEQLGTELKTEIDVISKHIIELAGRSFNINSPKQLGEVLFVDLGLASGKKTKTKSYSTSAEVLEELRGDHPIVDEILRYRMLWKLHATYVEGLQKILGAGDVVHTVFKQNVTATGRLSSVEPNLQNIPVREEEGRRLRKMFVAREGCTLVSADYSQIELRLLAHLSGEEALIEAYRNGEDIHTATAATVFGVPKSEVTPAMRRDAKAVNFGVIYGISDFGLAKNIGVSVAKARKYISEYFMRYPKVKAYLDECVALAHAHGKLQTLLGRVRRFDNINSSNFQLRSFNERAAMNMPMQGTAADLIKIAMLDVDKAFRSHGLKAQLLCQVHDELIVECPESEVTEVKRLLTECMEQAMTLSVPLVAEAAEGKTWFDLK